MEAKLQLSLREKEESKREWEAKVRQMESELSTSESAIENMRVQVKDVRERNRKSVSECTELQSALSDLQTKCDRAE